MSGARTERRWGGNLRPCTHTHALPPATSRRYVIDFYNSAPLPSMPVAMHLDVRPALDSPAALWDRLCTQWGWVASGRWRGE